MRSSPLHAPRAELGSTLVEVLVAILILSIGLLGAAGMQAASLRYAHGASARAALTSGISSLAERMRANSSAATTAYVFDSTIYADQRTAINDGSVQSSVTASNCLAVTCTPAALASFDLATWQLGLDAAMPGAAGFVQGNSQAGYLATIMWFDKSYTYDTDPKTLVKRVDKDCGTSTPTGVAQRSCCPSAASAPDGVRCVNFTVIP